MFGRSSLLLMGCFIGLSLGGAAVTVPNGEVLLSSDGQTISINCHVGYSARQTQVTSNNKTYTLLNCVQDCGEFAVINGEDVVAGMRDGTTVNISCGTGMKAVPKTATCLNGAWCASSAICIPVCDELVVENGETVPAGVVYGQTISVSCNAGFTANPAQTACNNGVFSEVKCESESSGCILLMGGYDLPGETPVMEYYYPSEGVECNVDIIGNMSTDRVDETHFTSGCYLSATRQIVIREEMVYSKPPIVYGLEDGSATPLPLIYENNYVGRSTASSVGISKCVSCGGVINGITVINNCYQFDPLVDASQWTPIAPMPKKSSAPASVLLTENDYYVVSGYNDSWMGTIPEVYHLNVGDGTWTTESSMLTERVDHAAAPLSNTEFIVCGGYNIAEGKLSSCEIYDAVQKEWRTTGNLNYGRSGHVMINFGGEVYALGAWGIDGNRVEKYDQATGMWEMAKALKNERSFFVGVAV